MRLQGKTALITGASRNIGRAIALTFAAEGADLVLNTRANRDELEAVAAECRKAGVRAVPVLGDIADAAAVEAMVKQGLAELGAIDVLVCNAAIRPHTALAETSLEDWHRVIGVNLHSAFYLAKALAPPPVAAEWCLPLVRPGGAAILWVGETADLDQLAQVAALLAAEPADAPPGLAVLRKLGPTPAGFPRRTGVARKRPLTR